MIESEIGNVRGVIAKGIEIETGEDADLDLGVENVEILTRKIKRINSSRSAMKRTTTLKERKLRESKRLTLVPEQRTIE